MFPADPGTQPGIGGPFPGRWWAVLVILAWVRWAYGRAGYAVRPYDMLADRRRWFWQPRTQCGWPARVTVEQVEVITRWLSRRDCR